jgi:hypothetical protein
MSELDGTLYPDITPKEEKDDNGMLSTIGGWAA